ncbi:hypothetical protein [Bosea sp. 124]|uniref:hypothetical protein n=1 Tax=Bosea sp. 124 TaxID=2135642 RepID=UPI000D366DFD|nr:hypothetical protein [Bosea sp. 124]PTM38858.1 hypothetical protein C8D03_0333 [Bosea sp. 124]
MPRRRILLSFALTFGLSMSTPLFGQASAEPRFTLDASGRKIVAVTNLPTASGCQPATGTGRIVERQFEKGQLRGVMFREPPYDDAYINLPDAYQFRNKATHARTRAVFDDLLREGNEVRLGMVACGAAGRVVKLTSIALIARASAPVSPSAASPSPAAPPAEPMPAPATSAPPASSTPATSAAAAADDEASWDVSTYQRNLKLGIADGNHFTTLMLDCVLGSGRVKMLVDDPKGRYRRGSTQPFRVSAGQAIALLSGTALFSDMNSEMQIEANVSLSQLRGVLSEIARQRQFVITTPGGTQPVDVKGADKAIPTFLSSCAIAG